MRDEVATRSKRDLLPGYEEWLERLSVTYRSVAYCCFHRLRDREAAERVSVEVVVEMLARPKVFRYFGLPFSGQVARLAEPLIAESRQGTTVGDDGSGWQELLIRLRDVAIEHQEVFVLTCIEGYTAPEVAGALGCDEDTARLRQENTMNLIQELSESVLTRREHTDKDAH